MSSGSASAPPETSQESDGTSRRRPIIIGIYGVPGSGKTDLLSRMHRKCKPKAPEIPPMPLFKFYDSSDVIARQVPGGLEAFKALGDEEKERTREAAIRAIRDDCMHTSSTGVVAGHYSFWDEGGPEPERVMTRADRETYTHIVYLDTPANVILGYRQNDTTRRRQRVSERHLRAWIDLEKSELRRICYDSGILFSVHRGDGADDVTGDLVTRVRSWERPGPSNGFAMEALEETLNQRKREKRPPETAIVLDADRTIAPKDSGTLFWKFAAETIPGVQEDTLKAVFGSKLGYSCLAFHQAAICYGDVSRHKDDFHRVCGRVAADITLYPEILAFLREAAKHEHVVVIVATCGLQHIWQDVVQRDRLEDTVKVIGTDIGTHTVVTPQIKKDIVSSLRKVHGLTTWAFGDSPIDIPMLEAADHPVVVVGEGEARSNSMDEALAAAVDNGLDARQVLLPSTARPRLDADRLAIEWLTSARFTALFFRRRREIDFLHATDKPASRLLMTPTRDASVFGPRLREAHHRVGLYLATEYVAQCIGVEEFPIPHVTGAQTGGFRLKDEAKTLIVALMRAGEPMASGVSTAFPTAMFLHAKEPGDLAAPRIKEASAILLVDGVINEGTTAVKFVQHIRGVEPGARVVIVTGVVQGRCVGRDGGNQFWNMARDDEKLSLVALRISDNKYTGKGAVDTGNRLFNTTHLP